MTEISKKLNIALLKLKKKFLNKNNKNFSTFEECEKYCDYFTKNSYSNDTLNNFRLERFILNINNLDKIHQPFYKFLFESISYYLNSFGHFPKIIDLGGGFGDGFLYLKHIFNKTDIHYSVVEQKKLVELSKNINFGNKSNQIINFYDSMDDAFNADNYDILFSSGTLQCLKNPYHYLEKINNSNIKVIGLTRNDFGLNEQFFAHESYLFSNGSGHIPEKFKNKIIFYPYRTLEKEKIINILNNFEISFTNSSIQPEFFSKDILFKKKGL